MRAPFLRRCVHTLIDDAHVREQLRELLRETAQSVAVVTARLPNDCPTSPSYHGATLSSFASIALDPLPLVAFSLRVPSRMASALNTHAASLSPDPHLVINILSAAQAHLADRFARPDLYPRPFDDPCVPWSLSRERGLPIFSGTLGALSCALMGPALPLARVSGPIRELGEGGGGGEAQQASGGVGLASELFIARVLRVEDVAADEQDGRLPLLYHRRRYTTVRDEDC